MERWEKIETIQRMQDYIKNNVNSADFSPEKLYLEAGYSKRHADRMFKEALGKTPAEYVRAIRLSESAGELLSSEKTVLDIALDSGYDSHEGYTKAFGEVFHITPRKYRKEPIAIPLFVQYPVRAYYTYLYHKENFKMDKEVSLCMVTAVERPKRKLILLRSTKGQDYWSFCEEMGCDWDGLLNSIPEKFDTSAILELPDYLTKKGTTRIAAGVEVPADYSGKIPEGYELAELDECTMLYFQTEPFEGEENFCAAIDTVIKAIEKYEADRFGYIYDFSRAPKFNFGATVDMGAKMALPVRRK